MKHVPTWRTLLLLSLTLCALALPPGTTSVLAHAAGPPLRYRDAELIVRLRPTVEPGAFGAAAGLQLRDSQEHRLGDWPIYLFGIVDGTPAASKARALAGQADIVFAEPNYVGTVPEAARRSSWVVGADAGAYANQWAPARIGLPAAHARSRGAGITVAILDTGVDLSHPALVDRLVPGYDFVDGDATPQEEAGLEDTSAFGHGTHVAGLVALAAPDARIMPFRTLAEDGTGDLWTQMVALRHAVNSGAEVINLSFSFGERSQIFDSVLAEVTCSVAGDRGCLRGSMPGVVVVAAAGNSGDRAREWPGASPLSSVIGVGASTEEDTLATFSTYGGQIVVAAPGDRIVSTVPGGGYAVWSGTSMAAPFVSGVAALLRADNPHLRPLHVIQRITTASDRLSGPVRSRLNAAAALDQSR